MLIIFVINLISDVVQVLSLLIIVRAVLTWIPSVDYGHPVIRAIVAVTDPVLLPIRRLIPPLGGIDITPIVALILIQIVGTFLIRLIGLVAFGGA